ncbi:FAD-dependent oxidoreductase [Sphingomonas crocodyli]|uniref:FAD-dependent oxidoreductase n=2 Tax=Sphingomonas crocodyli TaxID=1979270 RepID=A0A437MBS0_9SPHN|nr:FAD-dependent oxidoreductase [Sphingomonas crocodyli]
MHFDLLIVGAGPAGMSAAIAARELGLSVLVVDDQPAPGGQIWRSIELTTARDNILGPAFVEGRAIAQAFRASGAIYRPTSQLWRIEAGFHAYMTHEGKAECVTARAIILATGAQERPVPFPGWTLPGVLTVGAAQILLKNAGQIPTQPVWIAGSGPLPLLYATQLLSAGGRIAGYLDTTPAGRWLQATRHFPGAMRGYRDLLKGLYWSARLHASGFPIIKRVAEIEALGKDQIQTLRYRTQRGAVKQVPAELLLVHEGVVPNIHAAMSMDCALKWNAAQDSYTPVLDDWGESSQANVFIAGDGAGIGGAKAACLRGELAGLRVAMKLGAVTENAVTRRAHSIRARLHAELAVRPFLDAMFRPRKQAFVPPANTIACRCEEVTAGAIRAMANLGRPGPNQVKAATRCGMGPCQGRQCGYTVTRILADAQNRSPEDVGYFHIRPPLKPVTLKELASLNEIARSDA